MQITKTLTARKQMLAPKHDLLLEGVPKQPRPKKGMWQAARRVRHG
jgi:hypothetical protein